MRLSEWQAVAPSPASVAPKVLEAVESVLPGLGADADPTCWIAWGDDPAIRYTILALAEAGLVICHVRVNVPQEGPRVGGKLVRWPRITIGELSVERQGGHALTSFQVESVLLRGVDDEGDRVTEFALELFAGLDGRPMAGSASVRGPGAGGQRSIPALPPPGGDT